MEEQQSRETEIRMKDLWAILKHCWWQLLLVMVLVSIVLYIGLNATHEDEYTANMTIYVLALPSEDSNGNMMNSTASLSWATRLIYDFELLSKSHDHVLQPVLDLPKWSDTLTWNADELEKMLKVQRVNEDALVVRLSLTTYNAKISADLLNDLGKEACKYYNNSLKQELVSVVDEARVPTRPSNPISMMMVLLIGFVAAVGVYLLHFIRFLMDDKINTPEDVEKYLGLSMLGVIPNRDDTKKRKSKYGYYYHYSADGEKKRA